MEPLINATCTNTVSTGVAQTMFVQLLSTLIKSYCDLNPIYPEDMSSKVFDEVDEYDFIVVGAGSAGSAIANRLSEIADWKVLLIEAGLDPPVESNIPALWPSLLNTQYDWKFITAKAEESCRGMVNSQCGWAKAKMLGGSSSMNLMFYVRGNPKDYDNWEALGNRGWSYDNVLKYFKKLENVKSKCSDRDMHGYDGYVDVSEESPSPLLHFNIFQEMIKNAAYNLGYPYVEDMVARMQSGVTNSWGTIGNGTRSSTARAYLASIRERKSLLIMKDTLVTRLLVNGSRIHGVEVHKNGTFKKIMCNKEVIVSAGAVNTPKLLMLSGIGPKHHLEQLGLPVIADLKVGYNLLDHILLWNVFLKFDLVHKLFSQNDIMYKYLTERTQLDNPGINTVMFLDSTNRTEDYPDLQYHFLVVPPNNPLIRQFYESINAKREIINEILRMNENAYLLKMLPVLLRPKSRGRLLLTSTNPFDMPKIITGYLTHPDDVETFIRGLKFTKKLIGTGSFTNGTMFVPSVEECKDLELDSDDYYECYVRNLVSTVYHVAGTCKMGPEDDIDAVVDPRLRVYGVSGLRIADTSIMPELVSGNTNVPAIMIGEKAADMIKQDWLDDEFDTDI